MVSLDTEHIFEFVLVSLDTRKVFEYVLVSLDTGYLFEYVLVSYMISNSDIANVFGYAIYLDHIYLPGDPRDNSTSNSHWI